MANYSPSYTNVFTKTIIFRIAKTLAILSLTICTAFSQDQAIAPIPPDKEPEQLVLWAILGGLIASTLWRKIS